MLLVDHKDILLERYHDVLIRAKLEVVRHNVRLIFSNTIVIELSTLDALEIPWKVNNVRDATIPFGARLQVITKGPVDVTIVFSSLSIPVLNLSTKMYQLHGPEY